jgi:hypothetical protein
MRGRAVDSERDEDERFSAEMTRLRAKSGPAPDYARPFVRVFAVTGAAVSTLGDVLGNQTVSASDEQAARLDELQFDLGEGPCWDALRLSAPVLEPDVRARPSRFWPAFAEAILDDEIGALFAFPLAIGPLKIGAVDMYTRLPAVLDQAQTSQATNMADLVARRILEDALRRSSDEYSDDIGNPYSRRMVHQATGMVLAQLDISADDARLVIQGHAFANNRSMMDVSRDILDGRLDFSIRQGRIEDSE